MNELTEHCKKPFLTIKFGLLAIILLFSLHVLSAFVPSGIYSIFALIIFCVYMVLISKSAPATFVLLLTYVFMRLTVLVSGVSIEFGAEMIELELFGYATGSMLRLVMVYIFFVTIASFIIEPFYSRLKLLYSSKNFANKLMEASWVIWFFFFVACFSLIILAKGAQIGYPLFTGISRLAFREEVESKIFLLYISNRNIFIITLGMIYASTSGYRKVVSLFLFIAIMIVSILFGEKFTSLIHLGIFMFTPALLLSHKLTSLNVVKIAIPLGVFSALTLPVILFVYGWSDDPVAALERLGSRMSAQAQLWYVADSETSSLFAFDFNAFAHNLESFLSFDTYYYTTTYPYIGARYFMFNYMSQELLILFLETEALTLTMAFEAYLLITNGWLFQFIPLFICSVIYSSNLVYLMYALTVRDPISVFFSMKLLIWTGFAIQQGELMFMLGIKTIGLAAFVLFYEKIIKRHYFPSLN